MKTDVVIIGGGIIGCAAAYYLTKNKIDVIVIEKRPAVGLEASGRNGGGVRQQGRKAALPMAMESIKLWKTLKEDLNADLEYQQCGNLKIAFDQSTAENYEKEAAWEHENGLTDSKLLTEKECLNKIPTLTKKIHAGKLCPSDGTANPMLVSPAFARAAERLGARFMLNTSVTGLLMQGKNVKGVKISEKEVEAKTIINAAGPWAGRFNEMAGSPVIIKAGKSQLMITERIRNPFFDKWVALSKIGYIRPTQAGNLVIGTSGTINEDFSKHVNFHKCSIQANYLTKLIPEMKDISIIRAFAGITEYTPDKEPYIGAVEEAPGLYIAAGFHGQGFCPGPIVGKTLAEMIDGKKAAIDLNPFQPNRFGELIRSGKEPQVHYPFDEMSATWSEEMGLVESLMCN